MRNSTPGDASQAGAPPRFTCTVSRTSGTDGREPGVEVRFVPTGDDGEVTLRLPTDVAVALSVDLALAADQPRCRRFQTSGQLCMRYLPCPHHK